jgi:hypothetical protein
MPVSTGNITSVFRSWIPCQVSVLAELSRLSYRRESVKRQLVHYVLFWAAHLLTDISRVRQPVTGAAEVKCVSRQTKAATGAAEVKGISDQTKAAIGAAEVKCVSGEIQAAAGAAEVKCVPDQTQATTGAVEDEGVSCQTQAATGAADVKGVSGQTKAATGAAEVKCVAGQTQAATGAAPGSGQAVFCFISFDIPFSLTIQICGFLTARYVCLHLTAGIHGRIAGSLTPLPSQLRAICVEYVEYVLTDGR